MARSFWKGSISFGLVEIGVTLKPASNPRDISFTLLDRNDFSPVGFKRYNKSTGREVPWERVVRGYEFEEDQYVVLTDEELRSANAEATETIDLVEFVEKEEIPPIYFDSPYYVEPQRRSSKSYQLLLKSLEEAGLVAIARVVLRTRQHVAALYPHAGQLLLVTLRYENELRKPERSEDGGEEEEKKSSRSGRSSTRHARGAAGKSAGTPPSPAEIRMATRLIQEMKAKWKPAKFKDEYRDDVLAMVDRKVKSGKIHEIVADVPERPAREPREVVDLMPLLKKSLESRSGRGESKGGRAESRSSKASEPRGGTRAATRTRSHSPRHAEPRRRRA